MAYYPRLKELRLSYELTQKNIARLLHITQQQYSNYENGHNDLPISSLIFLADFYCVSIEYILGRSNDPSL